MNRSEILSEANRMVGGQREQDYGKVENSFSTIASFWSGYLKDKPLPLCPEDVAVMMILLKAARLKNDPTHKDSWIDTAGYAACGGEIGTDPEKIKEKMYQERKRENEVLQSGPEHKRNA